MLIDRLKSEPLLRGHIRSKCQERAFAVEVCERVETSDVIIISVDSYYSSQGLPQCPPSPDCLIVLHCNDGSYSIFIVELRDIDSPRGFNISHIQKKFATCIGDFMSNVLREYFLDDFLRFKKIELLFVTDPYGESDGRDRTRFGRTTKLDHLLSLSSKLYNFRGYKLGIQHFVSNPLITPC